MPCCKQPRWVGEAFEVCPTQVLSCLELSVDLQTLSPPTSPPPSKVGAIRTGQGWKPFTATLPLLPLLAHRSRGCWSAGTLPAGDLLHLRRGGGVEGPEGIRQSFVSNITHNLEVKDTGDRRGSAHRFRFIPLSLSLSASYQFYLQNPRLRHLAV